MRNGSTVCSSKSILTFATTFLVCHSRLPLKTGSEWEIYGALAERLEHPEDAKEAYKLCLTQKLSVKALLKILETSSKEGDITETLNSCIKLSHIADRTYQETTYPSPIARCLFRVIRKHGLAKVMNVLIAMKTPPASYKLVT